MRNLDRRRIGTNMKPLVWLSCMLIFLSPFSAISQDYFGPPGEYQDCLLEGDIEEFIETKSNVALVIRFTGGLGLADYIRTMNLLNLNAIDPQTLLDQWRSAVQPLNARDGVAELFKVRDVKGTLPLRFNAKSPTILDDLQLGQMAFAFFEGQDDEGNYVIEAGDTFTVTPSVLEYLDFDLRGIIVEWIDRKQLCKR